MRYALMQPYFFPYIGYYSLIKTTKKWIVFDEAQYIKNGWINRNRILTFSKDWTYINIPVKKFKHDTPINEIKISNHCNWRKSILNKLKVYEKKAPFYDNVIEIVNSVIEISSERIIEIIIQSNLKVCEYLNIPFYPEYSSNIEFERKDIKSKHDWAIHIGHVINSDEFINLPEGTKLYDKKVFLENGVKLNFLKNNLSPYNQHKKEFIPALSIIDVLMFNSPSETLKLIKDFSVI